MSKSTKTVGYGALICFAAHHQAIAAALDGLVDPGLTVHAVTTIEDLKAAVAKGEPRQAFVVAPGEDPSTPPELYHGARDLGLVVISVSEHFRIAKAKADQVHEQAVADAAPAEPDQAPADVNPVAQAE